MIHTDAILNRIIANVLFQGVDRTIVLSSAERMEDRRYTGGAIIVEEHAEGDAVYLLLEGRVKICKVSKFGDESMISLLHEGDFFGELEFVDARPRSARVVALSECHVAIMRKDLFDDLLAWSREFVFNILRSMSLRLRTLNQTFLRHGEEHLAALEGQINKLHRLVEATKVVNSTIETDTLLELILHAACTTVDADRGTLFLLDEGKQELWSKVLEGNTRVEIRLPVGKGVAGHVAVSGMTINIADAYQDPRFNPEIDRSTGYQTKTILCKPLKNKDGAIIGVIQLLNKRKGQFTVADEEFIDALSVHAALALENARIAREMVANERLSAVGRMASTIIHDIKNPMGVLRVSAQIMQRKAEDEEVARLAGEMIRQVDRLVNMTQEILDFSRGVSSLNIRDVKYETLIATTFPIIELDLGKRGVRVIQDHRYQGTIRADRDKLMRVFYNIAGNAADAMPDGGELRVVSEKDDDHLVILFTDTGHGMSPEVKSRIFEPFMTHGKKHGTGLGMAIVKKIIDDHHGTIDIASEVGKGTTVRLRIPVR